MKLPEEIKIGQMKYKILRMDGDTNWGSHAYGKARICLDDEMVDEAVPFTLWHEILHAILYQAGCRQHTIDDEDHKLLEQIVSALPFGLVQVLRDNPIMRDL